jgi:hypothetical protein
MADLVESHEVGHLISERWMPDTAFMYPSMATASLHRAPDVVLSTERHDVLPPGHRLGDDTSVR